MPIQLNAEQCAARDLIVQWAANAHGDERIFTLGGAAGTGKSTLMATVKEELPLDIGILWTATTGKAARRLSECIGSEAVTLHSRLYEPPKDSQQLTFDKVQKAPAGNPICVVDESSMITPKVWEDMEQWIEKGVRFLLVGDPYQLPPILSKEEEKKSRDFTVFAANKHGAVLDEVMRSDDEITSVATAIRRTGILPMRSNGAYEFRQAPCKTAVMDWLDEPEDHTLITWRNSLRMKANRAIRASLGRKGAFPEVGENVLFCRNGQGVLNGEIAQVATWADGPRLSEIQAHEADVMFDDGSSIGVRVSATGSKEPMDGSLPWVNNWGAYRTAINDQRLEDAVKLFGQDPDYINVQVVPRLEPVPVTWSYALTAHKAQGSEWDRVTVFLASWDATSKPFCKMTMLPNGKKMSFAMRWLYTAITRARSRVTVVMGAE